MEGDLAAFCRQEHPRLVGALYLYCGDRELAADLAQEALARVCERWPTVSAMEAPGAWVHRVAMNLAKSHLRRRLAERRANRKAVAGETRTREHVGPERVAVMRALAALTNEQRRVLVLRHYLGYSVAEVASILDMPENTVKTHSSRGTRALEVLLGHEVGVADA